MIDERTLLDLSGRFRDSRQLERDYLLTLLLSEIYRVFSTDLIFKGGTALKYFYGLNRFSEDLDFTYAGVCDSIVRKQITNKIEIALKRFGMQYSISAHETRANKEKESIIGLNHIIRVAGPFNKTSGQLQNINIDISLRNDLIEKPVLNYISPIYPDITTFSVLTMNVDEILAEKIAAIIEREKMRDIYDTYYLIEIRKIKYDEDLVAKKLSKRHEKFDKKRLKARIEAARDKMRWKSELSYLIDMPPDNIDVVSKLNKVFDL